MQEQEVQFAELNEVPFRDLKIGYNYLIQDSSHGDVGKGKTKMWSVTPPPYRPRSRPRPAPSAARAAAAAAAAPPIIVTSPPVRVNPDKSLRAKGITYRGEVKFSFDEHTVEVENPFTPSLMSRKAKEGINFGNISIFQLREGDPLVRFESIEPLNKRERDSCVICDVTLLKPFNEGYNKGIGYKFYSITQDELDKRTDALRLRDTLPDGLGIHVKEIISEQLSGVTDGSLKSWRHINTRNPDDPAEKRRLLATATENRRQKSGIGGYKNNLKNKKKSKKNKKNKKYNRNKATMKIKQKNKRKTRTKKMKMKKYKN